MNNSLAWYGSDNSLTPRISPKRYKVFLVEEGDDDRERVISALAKTVEIIEETDDTSLYSNSSDLVLAYHRAPTGYTVRLELTPKEDGTFITIENFNEDASGEDLTYSSEEEL